MLKRMVIFLFVVCVCLISIPALAANPITLFVNGQKITPEVSPVLVNGRVILPAKAILEPLGAQFTWDSKTRTVTVFKGEKKVVLVIGRKEAKVNGIKYILDTPPSLVNGRTLIPLRFVAEAFGTYVEWNSVKRTVQVLPGGGPLKRDILVTGYYFDWRSLNDMQTNINKITDIINFSYELNSQGGIQETNYFDQGYQLARQKGMSVEMLVFANNREQLKKLLNDTAAQEAVIEDIYNFLQLRNYDGINMDFEYVDPDQGKNYVNFIKAIKNKIGSKYTISLSLPARSSSKEWWNNGYDYAALSQMADRILIMTYDQHYPGGDPGPVAGNDWVEQVVTYLLQFIPKEKFQLGLGIYGYDWPENGQGKALYVQAARDLAAAKGATIQKDKTSGVSWFTYKDEKGVKHQVWFEDQESAQAKMELVKKYDLSGVALWRLGIIPPDIWGVINRN